MERACCCREFDGPRDFWLIVLYFSVGTMVDIDEDYDYEDDMEHSLSMLMNDDDIKEAAELISCLKGKGLRSSFCVRKRVEWDAHMEKLIKKIPFRGIIE